MKSGKTLNGPKLNQGYNIGDRVHISTSASDTGVGVIKGKWMDFGLNVTFNDRPNKCYVINLMHEKITRV